jgi:hypothetical protein
VPPQPLTTPAALRWCDSGGGGQLARHSYPQGAEAKRGERGSGSRETRPRANRRLWGKTAPGEDAPRRLC